MSELDKLRRMIDEVDSEILRLVARRIEIARRIGELKKV
ncbi:MAG: chorismate mutase, partial [Thaumarchaeota archaeon]|nr:chorismate mutase [Nitrososphaerota archaeon]